jgi:hypothetical protein
MQGFPNIFLQIELCPFHDVYYTSWWLLCVLCVLCSEFLVSLLDIERDLGGRACAYLGRERLNVARMSPVLSPLFGRELRSAHGAPLLEAFPAKDRPALRRAEGHRSFLPALRTIRLRFGAHRRTPTSSATAFRALGLASLAPLGLVLEALIREKHLFARSKDKLGATLRTLQDLIVVFH